MNTELAAPNNNNSPMRISAGHLIQFLVLLQLAYRRDVSGRQLAPLFKVAWAGSKPIATKYKLTPKPFDAAMKYAIAGKNLADDDGMPSEDYDDLLTRVLHEVNK